MELSVYFRFMSLTVPLVYFAPVLDYVFSALGIFRIPMKMINLFEINDRKTGQAGWINSHFKIIIDGYFTWKHIFLRTYEQIETTE